jgi:hypothetical protein
MLGRAVLRCPGSSGQPADPAGAGYCPHCGRGDVAPTADELDTAQRRAVRLVERIGDARVWARSNLDAEQQGELLAILGTGPAAARQGPK